MEVLEDWTPCRRVFQASRHGMTLELWNIRGWRINHCDWTRWLKSIPANLYSDIALFCFASHVLPLQSILSTIVKIVILKHNSLSMLVRILTPTSMANKHISHCLYRVQPPPACRLQGSVSGQFQGDFLLVSFTSRSSESELLAIALTWRVPSWLCDCAVFAFSQFLLLQSRQFFRAQIQRHLSWSPSHTAQSGVTASSSCSLWLLVFVMTFYHFPSRVLIICMHGSSPLIRYKPPMGWGLALYNFAFPSRTSPVLGEIFVQ